MKLLIYPHVYVVINNLKLNLCSLTPETLFSLPAALVNHTTATSCSTQLSAKRHRLCCWVCEEENYLFRSCLHFSSLTNSELKQWETFNSLLWLKIRMRICLHFPPPPHRVMETLLTWYHREIAHKTRVSSFTLNFQQLPPSPLQWKSIEEKVFLCLFLLSIKSVVEWTSEKLR